MSILDRVSLKATFENGDSPQGSDYANLIDSVINMAESTVQTLNGPIVFAGGISAASVSTGNITATGNMAVTGSVSAASLWAPVGNITTVSAQTITFTTLNTPASGTSINGNVTFISGYPMVTVDSSIACMSTVQASARLLVAAMNVIKLSVTGATDSVRLPGLYPGATLMVVNDTTQSAKVFPPTGGQINALGANAALDLGPNTGAIRQAIFYCSTSTQAYAIRGS